MLSRKKSETLDWLIMTTQSKFYARSKERYDLAIPPWIQDNSSQIINLSEQAGFISEIAPSDKQIDCVAILGATGTEMEKRISYVKALIETNQINTNKIFLLTGERYTVQDCSLKQQEKQEICEFVRQDGGYQYINSMANQHNINISDVTETHIMQDQYKRIIGTPAPYIVDTKKGKKQRPDTADTVVAFFNTPEYRQCKHTAFVSRAQNIAIENTYKRSGQIYNTFETIGDSAKQSEIHNKPSIAHHILMPIAGTIYGQYVEVCKKVSVKPENCNAEHQKNNLSYNAQKHKEIRSNQQLETPHKEL